MTIVYWTVIFSTVIISSSLACTSGAQRADPGTCRVFSESCLPEVCKQLKQYHWIDCDEAGMKQRVREKLKGCTDYNQCFNDLVNFNQITPANCRSRPEICMVYACDRVRSLFSIRCEENNYKERLGALLQGCQAPRVEFCLNDAANWVIKSRTIIVTPQPQPITPANCRSNPDYCLPYACSKIRNFSSRADCNDRSTKERVKRLLKECFAPQVDFCLRDASNWQYDDSTHITPANCRSRPDSCISFACNYVESRKWVRCSDGNVKSRLIETLRNCFTPKVDLCLNEVSKWQGSNNGGGQITPANCRSRPESCISYACQYVESRNWVRCSDRGVRDRLTSTLKNCFTPKVDICLNEVSKWRSNNDANLITPANCRSRTDSCMSYSCQYVESRNWVRCSDGGVKDRLTSTLKNCHTPKVDLCLNEVAKWEISASNITPAYCRANTDQCMSYACQKVQSLHMRSCTNYDVKNIVRDQLKNCFTPKVDLCLQRFPVLPSREQVVISPSICARDPEKCMPYSCDKVRKDYGKDCSNGRFRSELVNLLRRCTSASVDLCLVNVPYEINV